MICPSCGSKRVHRSHRKWYELPMKLIGIRPYRCHECRKRFFSAPESDPEKKQTSRES